jgi:hypothetical protein
MRYFLVLLLVLSSCGKFNEKFGRLSGDTTSVSFSVEGMESPRALLPGIMVYAVRSNDDRSRGGKFVPNEASPVNWVIPNGTYNFFAVGYSGAGMLGTMYCGRAMNQSLGGGAREIPITIRATGECGTPPFAPSGYSSNSDTVKPFYLGFCAASGANITNVSGSDNCDGAMGRPASSSAVSSVRITLPEFVAWDPNQEPVGLPGELASGCLNGSFTGTAIASGISVPIGRHFPIEIQTFSTSCSTFKGSYDLREGVVNASNATAKFKDASETAVFPGPAMIQPTNDAAAAKLYLRVYL